MIKPDMHWLADAEGRCLWVSDRYRSFVGRAAEDTRDDGWVMAVHPDDRERVIADVRERTQRKVGFVAHYRLRASDGQYYRVRDVGAPRFCEGVCVGYVGWVTMLCVRRRLTPHLGPGEIVAFKQLVTMAPPPVLEVPHEVRAESATG